MSKMDKFEEKIMPIADKVATNRYLTSIRDGFYVAMPLLIIGAICCLIAYFPVQGFTDLMTNVFGTGWTDFFLIPFHASVAVMSVFVVLGIAYSLSVHYEQDGISTAVIALVCFFILTPFNTSFTPEGSEQAFQINSVIPLDWIGSKGLFVGILSAILATEIVRWVYRRGWEIKMPAGVPPTVAKAFSSLIPGTITIFVFGIIRLIFVYTPYATLDNFIYTILQAPLTAMGDTLGATLAANFFICLFWMFGIAGADVVGSVMNPIWLALASENLEAFNHQSVLPHIITQQFNSVYLWIGGAGSTLTLCIVLMFMCKSQQCKKIGRLAFLPGLFNINEPITFGLPIVLNPIMAIPFILNPLILCLLTYFVMSIGLVPYPNGVIIPWTTPIIVGGFLVSGVRGAIWQIVEIAIGFLVYLPFIKVLDKQYYQQEKSSQTGSAD
jgi:PTS system cellobiose-specific IIC component